MLVGPALAQPSGADIDPSKLVQVRLIADQTRAVAGTKITVGVEYTMAPDWHIYWTNPGDTGMPTSISFSINGSPAPTVEASFPTPHSFISPGDLVSFGYSDKAVVLAEVEVPKDAEGDYVVEAKTRYLMCADRCIPGSATVKLVLPVGLEPKASAEAALIAEAKKALPSATLPAGVSVKLADDGSALMAEWPASAGAVVGVAEKKGGDGFMLFPDRIPGILWRSVEVRDLAGAKPGAVAKDGLKVTIPFTVNEATKAAGKPIKAVLAWSPVGTDGKPGPVQAASISIARP
jgi:thiol:disulfide interchange protein DsbD